MNKHLRKHILILIETHIDEKTMEFNIDMLDEYEQNLLTSYICEYEDGCEFYLAITENLNYETIETCLHGLMRSNDAQTNDVFVNVMKNKITNHYRNKMEILFAEVLSDYLIDRCEYYKIESNSLGAQHA